MVKGGCNRSSRPTGVSYAETRSAEAVRDEAQAYLCFGTRLRHDQGHTREELGYSMLQQPVRCAYVLSTCNRQCCRHLACEVVSSSCSASLLSTRHINKQKVCWQR